MSLPPSSTIVTSSPSCRFARSIASFGSLSARLLPHLEIVLFMRPGLRVDTLYILFVFDRPELRKARMRVNLAEPASSGIPGDHVDHAAMTPVADCARIPESHNVADDLIGLAIEPKGSGVVDGACRRGPRWRIFVFRKGLPMPASGSDRTDQSPTAPRRCRRRRSAKRGVSATRGKPNIRVTSRHLTAGALPTRPKKNAARPRIARRPNCGARPALNRIRPGRFMGEAMPPKPFEPRLPGATSDSDRGAR
jgi:hypothetical protein